MSHIRRWLDGLGLGQYADAFEENDVDLELLSRLTAQDLKDVGVTSVGHRRRLVDAITALNERSRAAEPGPVRLPERREGPEPGSQGAERRQLTVMFCDLMGSTALAEELDPEDLRTLMQAYQQACRQVVERYDGHVAQYLGDGIMAYFGWPRAHEDDAERAVRAGLEIVTAIKEVAAPSPLQVRIGVATGPVVVGETGGDAAAAKLAVGETPNLAARVQGLAGPDQTVIADTTRRLAGGMFVYDALGEQTLKGILEPVLTWRVKSVAATEDRFEAVRGPHLTPFVGREEEVDLILRRWQQAAEGEGQVVCLCGEPGIGKSRITQVLRERVADEPHARLRFQCSPYHINSAFHPVIEEMSRSAGFERNDSPGTRLQKLATLLGGPDAASKEALALFAALLSIDDDNRLPAPGDTPQRQKEKTIQALGDRIVGLASRRPVLVLFEDVHWIDPSSLEALDFMVQLAERDRVLLVITFRPEFEPLWTSRPHVTLLTLNRLARRQAAALITKVADGKPLPGEVLEQILERTDGVPLFVEELTRTVIESGVVIEKNDRYERSGPLVDIAIPTSLQDSLMARLDRLAPVREVAQIGACIGREFGHDLLAAAADLPEGDLRDALKRIVDSGLVFQTGASPTATYTFKHALVQDVAYRSLLRSKRRELHTRIATALEKRFPASAEAEPEIVAHHYTEAGVVLPAIDLWLRAGERAAQRSAHLEAIAHLGKGLALLDDIPDRSDHVGQEIALLTALGTSLQATEGFAAPRVGEAFLAAEKLCRRTGETTKRFHVLQGLQHFHVVRAEIERAERQAKLCYALARREGDPTLLLSAHHMLLGSAYWMGQFDAACDHLDQALRFEEQVRTGSRLGLVGPDISVFVRAYGCHAVWHHGDASRAVRLSEDGVRRARAVADPYSLALALDYGAMLHQFSGNHDAAGELALEAVELCSEHHFAYYLAWATIIRGWVIATQGRVEDGLAQMQQGLADLEATGAGLRRPYYLGLLADAHVRAGRPEEGLTIVDQAIAVAESTSERWRDAELQRTKGNLLLARSPAREADAETCFLSALQIARSQKSEPLELCAARDLARLWCRQGRDAQARELIAPICDRLGDRGGQPDLDQAERLLDGLGATPRGAGELGAR